MIPGKSTWNSEVVEKRIGLTIGMDATQTRAQMLALLPLRRFSAEMTLVACFMAGLRASSRALGHSLLLGIIVIFRYVTMLSQSHDQQSKTPTFKHTDLSSVITEVALGLNAQYKEQQIASGTAVLIGKYLAITARHVIEDFWKRFETLPFSGIRKGNFHLEVFQIYNEGKTGALWSVRQIWPDKVTDIAFLHIVPASQTAVHYRWRYPRIDLIPPAVGTRVVAFGYHTPTIRKTGENHVEWGVNPYTSVGEVKQVHHEKRDTSRMPFPCFQTNARYDGGMSGGPVFTDMGHLCGLICSNLPPDEDGPEQEHVSYVTSLWPSMGVEITIDREGFPKNTAYPILDLARDGFITALGWERIQLVRNEAGTVIQVRLIP